MQLSGYAVDALCLIIDAIIADSDIRITAQAMLSRMAEGGDLEAQRAAKILRIESGRLANSLKARPTRN